MTPTILWSILWNLTGTVTISDGRYAGIHEMSSSLRLLWICNLNLEFSECETDVCRRNCLQQTFTLVPWNFVTSRSTSVDLIRYTFQTITPTLVKSLRQSWYGARSDPSHNLVWNFLISFIFVFADWDFASQFIIRKVEVSKLHY